LDQLLKQVAPDAFTLSSATGMTLPDYVLELRLTGDASVTARGNTLDNVIIANDGNDTLIAGTGSDILAAGSGNSTLVGNAEVDALGVTTFVYALGNGKTTILQSDHDDVLQLGLGIAPGDLEMIVSRTAYGSEQVNLASASGIDIVLQADRNNRSVEKLSFPDGTVVLTHDLPVAIDSDAPVEVAKDAEGRLTVQVLGNNDATVRAGSIDALITANSGNDTLVAGSGDATLVGGAGWTNFQSGAGNATFVSGDGAATYTIEPGSGNVIISHAKGSDLLQFGAGITLEDLSVRSVIGPDGTRIFMLTVAGGGTVTLHTDGDAGMLRSIQFEADGTETTLSQLLLSIDPSSTAQSDTNIVLPSNVVKMTLTGSADLTAKGNDLDNVIIANSGNDTLMAGTGNTTLVAGRGNDTLVGNVGTTTYKYALGDGKATILQSGPQDLFEFGAGIDAADLKKIVSQSADGTQSVLLVSKSGVAVMLQEDPNYGIVDHFSFADGSMLTSWDFPTSATSDGALDVAVQSDGRVNIRVLGASDTTVNANALDATITANGGNDTLVAGSGEVTLVGGLGRTEFHSGSGNAAFVGGGHSYFEIEQGSGNVLISHAGASDTLAFGDGISASGVSGHGVTGADGAPAYLLTVAGSGTVTLQDDGAAGLLSAIQFADGSQTTLSELLLATDPSATASSATDVVLSAGVVKMTLTGSAAVTVHGNNLDNVIVANDGNDTLIAGTGNVVLLAGKGDSTLVAGRGNDTLVGNAGITMYQYALGDGWATILQSGPQDVLEFGAGIAAADLKKIVSQASDGTQKVTLLSQSGIAVVLQADSAHGIVDHFAFADGSGLTSDELATAASSNGALDVAPMPDGGFNIQVLGSDDITFTANALDATITANGGNDILIGGSGEVMLVGGPGRTEFDSGSGNATFVGGGESYFKIVHGSGNVLISNTGASDILAFGEGISAAGVSAHGVTDTDGARAYVLTVAGGGTVTLQDDGTAGLVSAIHFGDGSQTTLSEFLLATDPGASTSSDTDIVLPAGVVNMTLTGSADVTAQGNNLDNVIVANHGNDTLIAGTGNNTLVAGSGNDWLYGGAGETHFVSSTGTANFMSMGVSYFEIVHASGDVAIWNSGPSDTLAFSGGISSTDLSVHTIVDADGAVAYVLAVNGGHAVTVQDDSGVGLLSTIEFADGSNTTLSQLLLSTDPAATASSDASGLLPAGVVNMALTGTDDLKVEGNALDDRITGNGGNDILLAGTGKSILVAGSGTSVLVGGSNNNTLIGGGGANFIVSGSGNDDIRLGAGATVVAFNSGDGADSITPGGAVGNTLSLGGGISESDLSLSKINNDLVLNIGSSGSITLRDWYAGTANHSFGTLQLLQNASPDFSPGSENLLLNGPVEQFDFSNLVLQFDQARASDANLKSWALGHGLLDAHLANSETTAIGGDLAFYSGTYGYPRGLPIAALVGTLSDPEFGHSAQAVHSWAELVS
jgi:Ca2+-binding RTX toxin-like protein